MKKLLSLCLVIALTISVFSSAFADDILVSEEQEDNIIQPCNDSPAQKPDLV